MNKWFGVDGHGHVCTEQGLDFLTVGQIAAHRCASHHVVLENFSEVGQRQQVFSGDFEGFDQRRDGGVGWGKHGEWTFCAQRVHEASFNHRCFEQGVVFAVHDDVHHGGGHRCGRQQHSVDDVHHTVVGFNVATVTWASLMNTP